MSLPLAPLRMQNGRQPSRSSNFSVVSGSLWIPSSQPPGGRVSSYAM
ncbi:hypothetical protein ACIPWY_20450 [Streptomyces sp. NPDC090032]